MSAVRKLTGAAYGVHFADQIALVSVPLIAALVFQAPAEVIGLLVACQSMAHLLGSIPFGILVDKAQQRTLAVLATLILLLGSLGAAVSVSAGSLVWFAITVTFAGFGVVLFTLTVLSILPKVVPPEQLANANAGIEFPRAVSTFAVPLCIGIVISGATAHWIFPAAAFGAMLAVVFTIGLPAFDVTPTLDHKGPLARIVDGGRFVWRNNLLRAISLCAVFWNFAFSALLVTMVPLLRDTLQLEEGVFGIALAAFGVAAIVGVWVSKRHSDRMRPSMVLLFGPASSAFAAALLFLVPAGGSAALIYGAFLLLGFGPSMWLVAQNSVRQILSPDAMLGRVNAVIQTTIYGVRPLAALIAGGLVGATSPQAGLALVVGGFALSFLAAALSGLRGVRSYGALKQASLV